MSNDAVEHALRYHDQTKHSPWSIRATSHYLDWDNQPLPLKIYTALEPILLPRDTQQTGIAALSAIAARPEEANETAIPSLKDIAYILYFSAGITRHRKYPGGEIYFRAAACTGALYEIELYLVCADLPDLKAGVYHFNPGDFALRRLRDGDYRAVAGDVSAPVIVICTGTYWRNSWKYRARTYRHFGWDNGTIIANMLSVTSALRLPAKALCGFVDRQANALLDADTEREVAFSMITIGHALSNAPPLPPDLPKLNLPVAPLSKKEVAYPELGVIHEASSLASREEVDAWGKRGRGRDVGFRENLESSVPRFEIRNPKSEISRDTIEQVILRRGSKRKFQRQPISLDQLLTILSYSTRGIPADFLEPFGKQLNDLYLIVNAVDGLNPGSYFYNREKNTLDVLREGEFRNKAQYLGLEQALPGDAAADVFFLADLQPILSRFGNRGYRAVQLEAGIIGGKLYLAAYAQRLGATGLTFYDDDVTEFFSPHAGGKSAIFLVALGKGSK